MGGRALNCSCVRLISRELYSTPVACRWYDVCVLQVLGLCVNTGSARGPFFHTYHPIVYTHQSIRPHTFVHPINHLITPLTNQLTHLLKRRREGHLDGAREIRVGGARVHDGALPGVELFLCVLVGWWVIDDINIYTHTHPSIHPSTRPPHIPPSIHPPLHTHKTSPTYARTADGSTAMDVAPILMSCSVTVYHPVGLVMGTHARGLL